MWCESTMNRKHEAKRSKWKVLTLLIYYEERLAEYDWSNEPGGRF